MKSIHVKTFIKKNKQSRKLFSNRKFHGFTKFQQLLLEQGLLNAYICDKEKNLLFWDHLDDPRNENYRDHSNYNNRIMNEDIIEWYKKDAKNLLEKY